MPASPSWRDDMVSHAMMKQIEDGGACMPALEGKPTDDEVHLIAQYSSSRSPRCVCPRFRAPGSSRADPARGPGSARAGVSKQRAGRSRCTPRARARRPAEAECGSSHALTSDELIHQRRYAERRGGAAGLAPCSVEWLP